MMRRQLWVLTAALLLMWPVGGAALARDGTPEPPTGASISAGSLHTCAVTADGATLCWGFNAYGQLGTGTTRGSDEPADVLGRSSGTAAVSAGDGHTCAVDDEGAVTCWGDNGAGELGIGVMGYGTGSDVPVDVVGLDGGVESVSAGHYFTCAVTEEGAALCWGGNSSGELGNGIDWNHPASPNSTVPVPVIGLGSGVAEISTGQSHTCALTDAGAVQCWGNNYSGQLGTGTTTSSPVPLAVEALAGGVAAISAGDQHTCALTEDGAVQCWGRNREGQLGNGSRTASAVPVPVTGLDSGVVAISAGQYHSCALTAQGEVLCWGSNLHGELGNGYVDEQPGEDERDYVTTPVAVAGLGGEVAAISAGGGHTCALTEPGEVWCWGDNYYGEIGDRTTFDRSVPSRVHGLNLTAPPELSVGLGGRCTENGATVALTLTGAAGADVTLTATSSDERVLPDVTFGGEGANRTVTVVPVAARTVRTATLTVTAEAATGSSAATVTVHVGTSGDDTLTGTTGADLVVGLRGDDRVTGRGGADTLCGGDGQDRLVGNDGADTLVGGDGSDDLTGGDDGDLLLGGDGADVLTGRDGEDTLVGGNGDDELRGGDENDVLRGERGRDRLVGNNGEDHLHGGRHADDLAGGDGNDQLYGGLDEDALDGGRGHDVLYGGRGADTFRGGPGHDAAYDFSEREGDVADGTVEYV